MPHPRRLRRAHLTDPQQLAASRHLAGYQAPFAPERRLVADGGLEVLRLLHAWSATRLAGRRGRHPLLRGDPHPGRRQLRDGALPLGCPLGAASRRPALCPPDEQPGDRARPCRSTARSTRRCRCAARRGPTAMSRPTTACTLMPGVGHFPHEEDPAAFTRVLLEWLRDAVGGRVSTPPPRDRDASRHGPSTPGRATGSAGRCRVAAKGSSASPKTSCCRRWSRSSRRSDCSTSADRSTRTRCSRAPGRPRPPHERDLWQGLAQLAVGLTHLARGNRTGAVTLLRRGAGRIEPMHPNSDALRPYDIDVPALVSFARDTADALESGARAMPPLATTCSGCPATDR